MKMIQLETKNINGRTYKLNLAISEWRGELKFDFAVTNIFGQSIFSYCDTPQEAWDYALHKMNGRHGIKENQIRQDLSLVSAALRHLHSQERAGKLHAQGRRDRITLSTHKEELLEELMDIID